MPKFRVILTETVRYTYQDEIEAETAAEAKLMLEDQIVNLERPEPEIEQIDVNSIALEILE